MECVVVLPACYSLLTYKDLHRLAVTSKALQVAATELRGSILYWRSCGVILPSDVSTAYCDFFCGSMQSSPLQRLSLVDTPEKLEYIITTSGLPPIHTLDKLITACIHLGIAETYSLRSEWKWINYTNNKPRITNAVKYLLDKHDTKLYLHYRHREVCPLRVTAIVNAISATNTIEWLAVYAPVDRELLQHASRMAHIFASRTTEGDASILSPFVLLLSIDSKEGEVTRFDVVRHFLGSEYTQVATKMRYIHQWGLLTTLSSIERLLSYDFASHAEWYYAIAIDDMRSRILQAIPVESFDRRELSKTLEKVLNTTRRHHYDTTLRDYIKKL